MPISCTVDAAMLSQINGLAMLIWGCPNIVNCTVEGLAALAQGQKQQRSNQGEPRKSGGRKRRKPLKRQQPERKGKYRNRQCRAKRKQHHKLSKLSVRHDTHMTRRHDTHMTQGILEG